MTLMLTGKEIASLMRKNGKTIRGLAAEHQITMKRVREVRTKGTLGVIDSNEWIALITGTVPEDYSRWLTERARG